MSEGVVERTLVGVMYVYAGQQRIDRGCLSVGWEPLNLILPGPRTGHRRVPLPCKAEFNHDCVGDIYALVNRCLHIQSSDDSERTLYQPTWVSNQSQDRVVVCPQSAPNPLKSSWLSPIFTTLSQLKRTLSDRLTETPRGRGHSKNHMSSICSRSLNNSGSRGSASAHCVPFPHSRAFRTIASSPRSRTYHAWPRLNKSNQRWLSFDPSLCSPPDV